MTTHGTSAQPAAPAPSRKWSVLGRLGGAACVLALASGLMAAQAQGSLSTDRAPHTSQQAPPQGPPPAQLSNYSLTRETAEPRTDSSSWVMPRIWRHYFIRST